MCRKQKVELPTIITKILGFIIDNIFMFTEIFISSNIFELLSTILSFKPKGLSRTSLAIQWLRLRASNAGGTGSTPGQGTNARGMGSIPGQGIKIPHATQCGQKQTNKQRTPKGLSLAFLAKQV